MISCEWCAIDAIEDLDRWKCENCGSTFWACYFCIECRGVDECPECSD